MNTKYGDFNLIKSKELYEEEKIDQILENITLNPPLTPYTIFCREEYQRFKKKDEKIRFKELLNHFGESWSKLKESQKRQYKELYQKKKNEYIKSIEIVRHFLFKDYNDVVQRSCTPYQIFFNEKLIDGLDKGLDPKNIKKEASYEWKIMDKEQKKPYFDRKKDNDNWFEKAKKIKKVTPISIFIHKQIALAKKRKDQIPQITELSQNWKILKYSEKNIYVKYAQVIKEEREKLKDIYELINGVKPQKPAGAYRIFLQEKAKEKSLKSFEHGKELWNKLTDIQKEEYYKKSHKLILAYKYKEMIYKKKLKRILPKRPLTAFSLFIKEKKGQKIKNGGNPLYYWKPIYNNLPINKKEKYEERAKLEREKYEKKMEYFKNVVFDIPKKPLNAFTIYYKYSFIDFMKNENYKNMPISEKLKKAGQLWKNLNPEIKKKYENISKADKKRFKDEMNQFNKFGYYKKNITYKNNMNNLNEENKEDDDDKDVPDK